ncbi:hypothetical protein [Streptacidiphilus sp. PAMC 29251]
MTDTQLEQRGPALSLLAESSSQSFDSTVDYLEWLYGRRIDDRADPSSLEWLKPAHSSPVPAGTGTSTTRCTSRYSETPCPKRNSPRS